MPSYTKDPRHYLASLPSSSWSHRRAGQKGHLPMLFGITMSRAFTWILFQASRCSLRSTNSTAIADGRASRNLSTPKMWSSSLTTATAWPESGVRSSHADSHLAISSMTPLRMLVAYGIASTPRHYASFPSTNWRTKTTGTT